MQDKDLCPCGSRKLYEVCCAPFHLRKSLPKTALELMRARFAAYALNIPEYIIYTTHKNNAQYIEKKDLWMLEISFFSKSTSFDHLEVMDFKEDGNSGSVVFIAHLSQDGLDVSFKEKSLFVRENGLWLYLDGQTEKSPS